MNLSFEVVTIVLASTMHGERVRRSQALGIALAMLGVIAITAG